MDHTFDDIGKNTAFLCIGLNDVSLRHRHIGYEKNTEDGLTCLYSLYLSCRNGLMACVPNREALCENCLSHTVF